MAGKSDFGTAATLGGWLDVSRQRVEQLTADGVLRKSENGKYAIKENVVAFLRWQRDESRRANKSAADSRVRDARAREIELKIAREQRELVPTDAAMALLTVAMGAIVARLDGLPAAVTRDLPLRRKIEAAIDTIKTAAADELAKFRLEVFADPASNRRKG